MSNAAGKVFQTIDMVRWEEEEGKIILFLLFPLLYMGAFNSFHSDSDEWFKSDNFKPSIIFQDILFRYIT